MGNLVQKIAENLIFVGEFLLIVFLCFFVAYLIEKRIQRRRGQKERILSTRKMAMIGLFSAAAAVLMLFEVPVPFAPPFYKIDLSELPILILSFAYGPVAGVMAEFVKILLKLVFKSTSTAFVGELANFAVGCALVLPAGIFYYEKKTKRQAFIACALGVICMTIFGSLLNAVYLLPKFAALYGMPFETIVQMGTKVNPRIVSVETMALYAVAPLNLVKGSVDMLLTILLYKRLSHVLKEQEGRR